MRRFMGPAGPAATPRAKTREWTTAATHLSADTCSLRPMHIARRVSLVVALALGACSSPEAPAPVAPPPEVAAPPATPEPPTPEQLGTGDGTIPLGHPYAAPSPDPTTGTILRVRLGDVIVSPDTSLSREVNRRVLRRHIGEVRACYATALTTTPGLAGHVDVRFVVGLDGHVSGVERSAVDLGATPADGEIAHAFETCLHAAFQHWEFPVPEGSAATVTVPIAFSEEAPSPPPPTPGPVEEGQLGHGAGYGVGS
jgi:hypothetical protein